LNYIKVIIFIKSQKQRRLSVSSSKPGASKESSRKCTPYLSPFSLQGLEAPGHYALSSFCSSLGVSALAFLVVFFFGVDFFVVFFGAALRVRVVRLVVLLRVGMCNSSLYADAPSSSPTIISGNWFYLVIENSIVI